MRSTSAAAMAAFLAVPAAAQSPRAAKDISSRASRAAQPPHAARAERPRHEPRPVGRPAPPMVEGKLFIAQPSLPSRQIVKQASAALYRCAPQGHDREGKRPKLLADRPADAVQLLSRHGRRRPRRHFAWAAHRAGGEERHAEGSVYNIPGLRWPGARPITEPIVAPPRTGKVAYGSLSRRPARRLPGGPHADGDPTAASSSTRDARRRRIEFDGPRLRACPGTSPPIGEGLGQWSDTEIEQAIRKGVGTRMASPSCRRWATLTMPTISAEDMGALIAFLRTLPPKKAL